jgi:hypothetical protein
MGDEGWEILPFCQGSAGWDSRIVLTIIDFLSIGVYCRSLAVLLEPEKP